MPPQEHSVLKQQGQEEQQFQADENEQQLSQADDNDQRLIELSTTVEELRRQVSELRNEMQRQTSVHEKERQHWQEEKRRNTGLINAQPIVALAPVQKAKMRAFQERLFKAPQTGDGSIRLHITSEISKKRNLGTRVYSSEQWKQSERMPILETIRRVKVPTADIRQSESAKRQCSDNNPSFQQEQYTADLLALEKQRESTEQTDKDSQANMKISETDEEKRQTLLASYEALLISSDNRN